MKKRDELLVCPAKFTRPSAATNQVSRPELLARLDRIVEHRVAFVCAPSGYGKTSLVIDWTGSVTERLGGDYLIRTCWATLDPHDDGLQHFWQTFTLSLEKCFPGLVKSASPFPKGTNILNYQTFVDQLIARLLLPPKKSAALASNEHIVIIIDDFHLIQDSNVCATFQRFIDSLPTHIHLVVLSRTTPRLDVMTMVIRNTALSIGLNDLRFSDEEVSEFFTRKIGKQLSLSEVSTIQSVVQGWPLGLLLSALSAREEENMNVFVQRFKSTPREAAAHFLDELLTKIDSDLETFLLQTSILSIFNAELCDFLLEREDSEGILGLLVRENYLIAPINGHDGGWFQYHQMFSDMLQSKLKGRFSSEEVTRLHQRASNWYATAGRYSYAIAHAEQVGDWTHVAQLVEEAYPRFVLVSAFLFDDEILRRIPRQIFNDNPSLYLIQAWLCITTDRPEKALSNLTLASRVLSSMDPTQRREALGRLEPELTIIRANAAGQLGEVSKGLALISPVLEKAEELEPFLQSLCYNAAGAVVARGKDALFATEILKRAASNAQQNNDVFTSSITTFLLGNQYEYLGRFDRAEKVYENLHEEIPRSGLPLLGLGRLAREHGEFEEAGAYLASAVDHIRLTTSIEFLGEAYIEIARLRRSQGSLQEAIAMLEAFVSLANEHRARRSVREVSAHLARLQLAAGDTHAAVQWAESSKEDTNVEDAPVFELQQTTLARVLCASGYPQKALKLLDKLLLNAMPNERFGTILETLLIRAMILNAAGSEEQALASMGRAITIAKDHGYLQILVDEGRSMRILLEAYLQSDLIESAEDEETQRTYIASVIKHIEAADHDEFQWAEQNVMTLTKRERDIYRLLMMGYTSREVSKALFISENTVNTHRKKIYAKLDIKTKSDLLERRDCLDWTP